MFKWERQINRDANINDFVVYDDAKIKWDRELRQHLKRGRTAEYAEDKVRNSLYRPFTKSNLYFDRVTNNCVYVLPAIFPTPETGTENRVICVSGGCKAKSLFRLFDEQSIFRDLDILAERLTMLSFLHLRRGREEPPGEHHRLGVGTIPGALRGQDHR